MSANKPSGQRGTAAVEFALVAMIFLTLLFGIIELARSMYLFNTLKEVTRRAANDAANIDFRDQSRLDQVRQRAIFRTNSGELLLGDPVTDQSILIDYLAVTRDAGGKLALAPIATGSLPSCVACNRVTCMRDPNDSSCIRFVRARICAGGSDGTCQAVQYKTLFSLLNLHFALPTSPTLVPAESLGFVQGAICP
ncbi:MAG: pilus assembly protein [Pseudomonadota bacterium]|nr:pilus assembly protein [Pseudomonadota bacterium]